MLSNVASSVSNVLRLPADVMRIAVANVSHGTVAESITSMAAQVAGLLPPAGTQTIGWICSLDCGMSPHLDADRANINIVNKKVEQFHGLNIDVARNASFVHVPAALSAAIKPNATFSAIYYHNDNLFINHNATSVVGSGVVSLTISGIATGQHLAAPVRLGFQLHSAPTTAPVCAYYDFGALAWKMDGCVLDTAMSSGRSVVCECRHLTNFAVLVNYNNATLSAADQLALGLITSIGLPISVFFMSLVVLVFVAFKAIRRICMRRLMHVAGTADPAEGGCDAPVRLPDHGPAAFPAGHQRHGTPPVLPDHRSVPAVLPARRIHGCSRAACAGGSLVQWMLREGVLLHQYFVTVFGDSEIGWKLTLPACYGVCVRVLCLQPTQPRSRPSSAPSRPAFAGTTTAPSRAAGCPQATAQSGRSLGPSLPS